MAAFDLAGERFGHFVVQRQVGTNKHQKRLWECLCDCGVVKTIDTGSLRSGSTVSCGCARTGRRTHGGRNLPEYEVWCGMKARCFNKAHFGYPYYGGRGITVCDRWASSFANFISDLGRRPTPKHTLERVDNDGNYEPGNCVWATRLEQNKNKRARKLKTHCKRGHALSGANIDKDRHCLICRKILWQEWSSRNKRDRRAA